MKNSDIKTFENAEFGSVRTITVDNILYFVGKDVAEILGYAKARNAISVHVEEEDKKDALIQGALGGTQTMTVINESGLYSLILSSKLPNAKRFKHWVTSEVLPSIRRHGLYATDDLINDPDLAIKAFTALKEERALRKQLEEKVEADKPKVLFAEAVETSKTSILIGDLAKLIKQNGIDIGQKRLFEYLRQNGYLIKSGNSRNMPTQRAMQLGLFKVKESTISNPDGTIRTTKTTKVTGKGQTYFINKFLSNSNTCQAKRIL